MMLEVVAVAVYLDLDTLKLCINKSHIKVFIMRIRLSTVTKVPQSLTIAFLISLFFFLSLKHEHVPYDTSNDVNA